MRASTSADYRFFTLAMLLVGVSLTLLWSPGCVAETSQIAGDVRCQTCGYNSSEWMDPGSPAAAPYIAAIVAINPALDPAHNVTDSSCRVSEFVTGCCVVRKDTGAGACFWVAGGQFGSCSTWGQGYDSILWSL